MHRKTRHRAEIAFVVLFLLVLGSSTLVNPFGRDQGGFAYGASAYLEGKTLYSDIFVDKPPLTYILFALSLKIFGSSMLSIRIMDWIWQLATALVLLVIADRFHGTKGTGVLSAVFYGLLYFSFNFKNTAQTDGFITLPLALGIITFLTAIRKNRSSLFFLAGLLVSIAFLFKYPVALLLFICLMFVLVLNKTDSTKKWYLLSGFCIPVLVFLSTLLLINSLRDLYDIHVFLSIMNFKFRPFTPVFFIKMLSSDFRLLFFHWIFLMALIYMLKEKLQLEQSLVLIWSFVSILHLIIQNKYFGYHALPTIAPQAIIASHMFFLIRDKAKEWSPNLRRAAVALLPALLIAGYFHYGIFNKHKELFSVLSGSTKLEAIYATPTFDLEGFSMRSILEVSEFVRNNSHEDDKIFVWGAEPAVYFLSGRDSASRFIYNTPLYETYDLIEYRKLFLQDLEINEPELIFLVAGDILPWITGTADDSYQAFSKFHEFRSFVEENYLQSGAIRNFTVYKRK